LPHRTSSPLLAALLFALAGCNCGERIVGLPMDGAPCHEAADCPKGLSCQFGACRSSCPCSNGEVCIVDTCFPSKCGATTCAMPEVCIANNKCGDPTCNGLPVEDFQTDVTNCGSCGNVCEAQNSEATCAAGVCGHGPCKPGFADLDPKVPGCESNCGTTGCQVGAIGHAMSSSTSRGSLNEQNDHVIHQGLMGDVTAPFAPQGASQATNGIYVHRGGFLSH
jgi:hypothetical protein